MPYITAKKQKKKCIYIIGILWINMENNNWWQMAYDIQAKHWSHDPEHLKNIKRGKKQEIFMDEYSWRKMWRDYRMVTKEMTY